MIDGLYPNISFSQLIKNVQNCPIFLDIPKLTKILKLASSFSVYYKKRS